MVSSWDQMSFSSIAVDQGQHLVEHPLRRVEPVGRVVGVEQHADFLGKRSAQPVQEMPVAAPAAAVVELLVFRVVGQIEQEALGLEPRLTASRIRPRASIIL